MSESASEGGLVHPTIAVVGVSPEGRLVALLLSDRYRSETRSRSSLLRLLAETSRSCSPFLNGHRASQRFKFGNFDIGPDVCLDELVRASQAS